MEIDDKRRFFNAYCNFSCPYIEEKKYFDLFGHYFYCNLYNSKLSKEIKDYDEKKQLVTYGIGRTFKCRHDGDNNAEMDSD